jgi:hypothetical protein
VPITVNRETPKRSTAAKTTSPHNTNNNSSPAPSSKSSSSYNSQTTGSLISRLVQEFTNSGTRSPASSHSSLISSSAPAEEDGSASLELHSAISSQSHHPHTQSDGPPDTDSSCSVDKTLSLDESSDTGHSKLEDIQAITADKYKSSPTMNRLRSTFSSQKNNKNSIITSSTELETLPPTNDKEATEKPGKTKLTTAAKPEKVISKILTQDQASKTSKNALKDKVVKFSQNDSVTVEPAKEVKEDKKPTKSVGKKKVVIASEPPETLGNETEKEGKVLKTTKILNKSSDKVIKFVEPDISLLKTAKPSEVTAAPTPEVVVDEVLVDESSKADDSSGSGDEKPSDLLRPVVGQRKLIRKPIEDDNSKTKDNNIKSAASVSTNSPANTSDSQKITNGALELRMLPSEHHHTNLRFIRKSLENSSHVPYSKTSFYYTDTDTIETEYPRNLDDNIEILSREAENLEKEFKTDEKLVQYGPIFDPEQFEKQRKQQKQKEDDLIDDDEAIAVSPCGRFFKYDKEVGRGSFKTVFRGLDTTNGVAVAWCELLVRATF